MHLIGSMKNPFEAWMIQCARTCRMPERPAQMACMGMKPLVTVIIVAVAPRSSSYNGRPSMVCTVQLIAVWFQLVMATSVWLPFGSAKPYRVNARTMTLRVVSDHP